MANKLKKFKLLALLFAGLSLSYCASRTLRTERASQAPSPFEDSAPASPRVAKTNSAALKVDPVTKVKEPTAVKSSTSKPFGTQTTANKPKPPEAAEICAKTIGKLPGKLDKKVLKEACAQTQVLPGCYSRKGVPIYSYDRVGKDQKKGKRILTLALIHGDETSSGSVAGSWITRLHGLDPRNSWRVLPVVNPDGLKLNTRTNATKVDINRNFPTGDWQNSAVKYWRVKKKSDPRRYPGPSSASEPETQCLLSHFEDFKPDFIISIHTPLGVLDFDGPKSIEFPAFNPLPWISLGNYPGSLGRYMWVDRQIPVLTIELKGSKGADRLAKFDRLQDISGTVAIQSHKVIKKQARNEKKEKDEKAE